MTAYVYTAAIGTPVYSGKINGQLMYASWGNSTNPINGWELRNASSTLYRSRVASYSATYIPMAFEGLIGDNVYYSNSVSQSSGTNSVVEYLYQSAGGAHYNGFYRSASVGSILASSSDQAFNMGGASGNVTWFRSLAGSVVSLGMTEDLYQSLTRTTTTTNVTTTASSVTTKVYTYATAISTLYSSYSYGSLLGTYTVPTSYTGVGTSLPTPLD